MLSYVARASLQLPKETRGEGKKRWEEKDGMGWEGRDRRGRKRMVSGGKEKRQLMCGNMP
jgi:hypothetical protein